jgi:hypothetical protein
MKALFSALIVLFLSILVGAYVIARQANPVFLDEHGKPVTARQHR